MSRMRTLVLSCTALGSVSGCSDPFPGEPDDYEYRATIRWTGHGIPHILADDVPSASFGQGYAFARLNGCVLADQVVKVRSERSRFFGPGEADVNLESDYTFKHLDIYARGLKAFEAQTPDIQAFVTAYVRGYNEFITTRGTELPCGEEEWLRPIDTNDLFAYYVDLGTLAGVRQMTAYIAQAVPPGDALHGQGKDAPLSSLSLGSFGSNGWGIGAERSVDGGGMLLANPHFPWEGELKLYESHLRVEGELDVYGAGLMGVAGILIGFNPAVAWTHTVSAGQRFTVYSLELEPGNPLSYRYGDGYRDIEGTSYTIDVLRGEDIVQESRTLYRSHYGPILAINPQLPWSPTLTFSVRDANIDNVQLIAQFHAMNRAGSMDEFQQAHADHQGIPWVNTMSTSAEGRAWYADTTPTPNLSDAAIAGWLDLREHDILTGLLYNNGLVLLPGGDPEYEWVEEPGARDPGLVPFAKVPKLERPDFIFNANDSHWLANPAQPLEGFSPMHGFERTPRTPRTRMNAVVLTETGEGGASGADGKFDFNELRLAALSNRGMIAELLRDQLVGRCQDAGEVPYEVTNEDGSTEIIMVDLTEACSVIAGWDRRLDLDSVGAIVWREFLGDFDMAALKDRSALFAVAFDPDDPIATPYDLAPRPEEGQPDRILQALAAAVVRLQAAKLPLDTPLGEAQFSKRFTDREHSTTGVLEVPIHGGGSREGVTNIVDYDELRSTVGPSMPRGEVVNDATDLTSEGYVINYGTSFIMTMHFGPEGPEASAFITYGQSEDPTSPYHADQMPLFSAKQWRTIRYTEEDIATDPELDVEVIFGFEE